jgi:hypothetical protein
LIKDDEYWNPCGGREIYRVVPKSQKIRLHNIAHYEYHFPGIYDIHNFVHGTGIATFVEDREKNIYYVHGVRG